MNTETIDVEHTADDSAIEPAMSIPDELAGMAALSAEMYTTAGAMVHNADLPGIWTERQKGVYRVTRDELYTYASQVSATREKLQKAVADLKWKMPARDRLLPVLPEIERQIAEMPDANRIPDFHEQKREWERQMGLTSSLKVLTGRMGVNWFGGIPALPSPLKEMMSERCRHDDCPHHGVPYIHWAGSLPTLEKEIAEAEQTIAELHGSLAAMRAKAAPLLAIATSITS